MASTIITAPLGTVMSPKFTLSLPHMTFDPLFANNVEFLLGNLTVISGEGTGQGACAYPEFAQNSGIRYWECTWSGLTSQTLPAGPGLCTIASIDDYATLAANGSFGLILRPDSSIYYTGQDNQQHVIPSNVWNQPQVEGDTVGIKADMRSGVVVISLTWCRGTAKNTFQNIFLPPGLYIPCVTFDDDNPSNSDALTGNFSLDRDTYLAPKTNIPEDFWTGVSWGWPNTA